MSVHDGGEMNGEGGPREDEESGRGEAREGERERERSVAMLTCCSLD